MSIYDPDIRRLLYLEFVNRDEFAADVSTKVIDEMQVCKGISRVDIAVINGKMHGFEIKSEMDTLNRLPSQAESYNKIFDTMSIITCKNHLDKVSEYIPKWWGIYYVNENKDKLTLKCKRKERINKNIDLSALLTLLWREELNDLLKKYSIDKGTKSKTRSALCKIVLENVDGDIIHEYVRYCLKSRKSWRAVSLQQLYDDLHIL